MRRRHAIPLAVLWVVALVGFDLWLLARTRVADAHLNRVLAELFQAPVAFGRLSLGPALDLVIEDVRMMRPDLPDKIYGTIDEIRVTPRWWDLLTALRVDVAEIAVTNPTVVVKWKPDRTFDMPSPLRSDLEARTRTMGELPAIALRGLTLVLENPPDVIRRNRQDFVFDDLAITLAPEGSSRWLYRFDVDVHHGMFGRIVGSGHFSKTAFEVHLRHGGGTAPSKVADVVTQDVAGVLADLTIDGALTFSAAIAPVPGGAAEALSAELTCEGVDVASRRYGLSIAGITGRVTFEQGVLRSSGLVASFEGAPIEARGKIDLTGATRIVEIEGKAVGLPVTNGLAAKIRPLPDPCPTVAEQIEAWDPDGHANIRFRLEQDRDALGAAGVLHPFIDVEFKGGTRLRYIGHVGDDGRRHGFPYPLEDLRGALRFTDTGVVFDRLTALNGSLVVEARGRIDYEFSGDETYDVDVDARGLRLDGRVSDALSEGARELFNSLDAEGAADLAVAVKRKKGEPPGPRVEIAVDLQGVALSPRPFPLDLADARGRVIIPDEGPVRIERITARRDDGSFSLSGVVPVRRGQSDMELEVTLERFPVDPAVTHALKVLLPDAATAIARLNPSGRLGGALEVGLDKAGALRKLDGKFAFEDMTLLTEDPSLRIEDLDGSVGITAAAVTIHEGTTAAIAGEHFAVHGRVLDGGHLDLVIEAENFHVDRELLGEIEPLIPWIRGDEKRPEVEGPMSVSLKITGDAAAPEVSAVVDLLGVNVDASAVPGLSLRDVRAHVAMSPSGVVTFRDVAARVALPETAPDGPEGTASRRAVTVEVGQGVYEPPARSGPATRAGGARTPAPILTATSVAVRGAVLDATTVPLLPISEEMRDAIAALAPVVAIDVAAGKVTWDGTEVSVAKAQARGTRFSLGAERKLAIDDVAIQKLSLRAGGGIVDARGDFVFRDCRFWDVPVPILIGKVSADSAGIRFESLEADLYAYEVRDGRRFALGKVNPETSQVGIGFDGTFSSRLRAQEVNLPATIRVLGGKPGDVGGTFRAALDLDGTLGKPETYSGRGDVSVRARNVVSLPVFYRMFQSLDVLAIFDRPDPWTRVEVAFGVQNRVLDMNRIRIDAPDVLLEGPGTLTFDGAVKADLKVTQDLGVSPIGWVTRIISRVVFSGVRIDGPIGDPRISPYTIAGR